MGPVDICPRCGGLGWQKVTSDLFIHRDTVLPECPLFETSEDS